MPGKIALPLHRPLPVSGRIFKVERGPGGEKLAYVRMFSGTVRMFSGTVRTRDHLRFSGGHEGKVTAIGVFERCPTYQRRGVSAGIQLRRLPAGDRPRHPPRRRTLADPRNREEYMLQLAGRATAAAPGQAESSGGR